MHRNVQISIQCAIELLYGYNYKKYIIKRNFLPAATDIKRLPTRPSSSLPPIPSSVSFPNLGKKNLVLNSLHDLLSYTYQKFHPDHLYHSECNDQESANKANLYLC